MSIEQESQPIPQAAVTPVTAPQSTPEKSASALVEVVLSIVLTAVIATIAAIAVARYVPQSILQREPSGSPPQPFVLVNMEALMREQILALGEKVLKGEITPNEMPVRSEKFSSSLMQLLRAYTEAGMIVLRTDAVIVVPEGVEDVTDKTRAELIKSGVMFVSEKQSQDK